MACQTPTKKTGAALGGNVPGSVKVVWLGVPRCLPSLRLGKQRGTPPQTRSPKGKPKRQKAANLRSFHVLRLLLPLLGWQSPPSAPALVSRQSRFNEGGGTPGGERLRRIFAARRGPGAACRRPGPTPPGESRLLSFGLPLGARSLATSLVAPESRPRFFRRGLACHFRPGRVWGPPLAGPVSRFFRRSVPWFPIRSNVFDASPWPPRSPLAVRRGSRNSSPPVTSRPPPGSPFRRRARGPPPRRSASVDHRRLCRCRLEAKPPSRPPGRSCRPSPLPRAEPRRPLRGSSLAAQDRRETQARPGPTAPPASPPARSPGRRRKTAATRAAERANRTAGRAGAGRARARRRSRRGPGEDAPIQVEDICVLQLSGICRRCRVDRGAAPFYCTGSACLSVSQAVQPAAVILPAAVALPAQSRAAAHRAADVARVPSRADREPPPSAEQRNADRRRILRHACPDFEPALPPVVAARAVRGGRPRGGHQK